MDLKSGILGTASRLGMSPVDLATIMSYETGGTFDPMQAGPTTKWGQHRGFIQFGEPQARQYGANFSDPKTALISQLGEGGAVENYFRGSGWKPGMSLLDAYSIVNAGAPGRYGASDTAAGGAPGTVRDKVVNQFNPHQAKALALLGLDPSMGATAMGSMDPAQFAAARSSPNVSMSSRNVGNPMLPPEAGATPERQSVIQQLMGGDFRGALGSMMSRGSDGGLPQQVVGHQRRAEELSALGDQAREGMQSSNAPASWMQVLGAGMADFGEARAQGKADQAQSDISTQLQDLLSTGDLSPETVAKIAALDPALGQTLMVGNIEHGRETAATEDAQAHDRELLEMEHQNALALEAMTPAERTALMQNAEAAGYTPGTPEYQQFIKEQLADKDDPDLGTTLMQNAQAAGYTPGTPEYQQFIKEQLAKEDATMGITGYDAEGRPLIGPVTPATAGSQPGVGEMTPEGEILDIDAKKGLVTYRTGDGQIIQKPIKGSEADIASTEAASQEAQNTGISEYKNTRLVNTINDARTKAQNFFATGLPGQVTRGIGGTPGYDLSALVTELSANVGFEQLQEMREASPTGGALGNVTENEIRFLQSVLGSLDPNQGKEQFMQQLDKVEDYIRRVAEGDTSIYSEEQFAAINKEREAKGIEPLQRKAAATKGEYEVGKVYEDANGNKARWTGTTWEPVQ